MSPHGLTTMLEATRGLTLEQLQAEWTARMEHSEAVPGLSTAEKHSAALAQLRVANALLPVSEAVRLAERAAQAGSSLGSARIMSRIRLERLPRTARASLEKTRRAARAKPGTERFGLGTGPRWILVPGSGRQQSAVRRIVEGVDSIRHTVLAGTSSWTARPTKEGLLASALGGLDVAPNDVLLVQSDGSHEYDVVWLAGALGIPCVVVEVVQGDPGLRPDTAIHRLHSAQHQLWQLQPVTWLRVSAERREVAAFDAVGGDRYRQGHPDVVGALRHYGAASVIGRDLEHFVQENQEYPDAVRPIADWIRRDIRRTPEAVAVCATIAERLWAGTEGSRAEIAASQLENLMLERPMSELSELVASATHAGRTSFIEQLRLRTLFLANDFAGVVDTVPDSVDRNTRALLAESRHAVALVARLRDADQQDHTAARAEGAADHQERIVCFLHASSPQQSGGYAIRAHGIFRALLRQGVNIMPVTRPGFPDELPPAAQTPGRPPADEVDGVTYRRLNATVLREAGEAAYMSACVDSYKAELLRLDATAVHVRSTFLIAIPAIIAAHELGLGIVYEVSGLWELVYQDREAVGALNRRAPFAQFFEEVAADSADRILTMNTAMIDLLVSRGARREKIALAPNAVDVEAFQDDQPVIETGTPVIGYIGSIVDYEGLPDLVEAAGILRDSQVEFRLVVVGDGLAMPGLKSAVARLRLGDRVQIRGRIPHDEVRAEYLRMAIMAYPRHSTPATDVITPLKPFEALAMSKAVVVSDVPPLREIAGDDERALAFPSGDAVALADRLQQFLENPELRAEFGSRGREWVLAERSWHKVVTSFQDAYGRLHGR